MLVFPQPASGQVTVSPVLTGFQERRVKTTRNLSLEDGRVACRCALCTCRLSRPRVRPKNRSKEFNGSEAIASAMPFEIGEMRRSEAT